MSPLRRKIIYALSFEVLGIAVAGTSLFLVSAGDAAHSFSLSALCASVAMIWSYIFNTAFEAWESRQIHRARTRLRRMVHAVLFEGGLLAVLLPLTAWWLSISMLQAMMLEAGLVAVFILYTYLFTFAFDGLFGPPISAQ